MKFLCLVYFEPHVLEALPYAEMMELRQRSVDYDGELRKRGVLIAATPLRDASTAVTLRTRGGKIVTTDGPFAETKEVLGGFVYIEAKDLQEALRLAADIPMARYGSIEVRETQTDDKCGPSSTTAASR
jgi:hypothetical protein